MQDADEQVLGGLSGFSLVVDNVDAVDEDELDEVLLVLVLCFQLVEMLGNLLLEVADLLVLSLDDPVSLIEHVC